MEQAEYDDQQKYSKKYREDVGLAAGQQHEGEQGGGAAVENSRAHVRDGGPGARAAAARHREECVADVDAVVDTEADCDDDVDGADHVDGDVPGRHEAADVDEAEGDGGEDEDGAEDVRQEDEGREEDAGEGEAEVPEELPRDDLVSLPVCILLNLYMMNKSNYLSSISKIEIHVKRKTIYITTLDGVTKRSGAALLCITLVIMKS